MCVPVHVYAYVYLSSFIVLLLIFFFFFDTESFTNPEAHWLAGLGSPKASPPALSTCTTIPDFLHVCWESELMDKHFTN